MSDDNPLIDDELLPRLLRFVQATSEEEMPCSECLNEISELAETELHGKTLAAAQALVKDHIEHCGDCKEEYQLLLTALQSVQEELGDS